MRRIDQVCSDGRIYEGDPNITADLGLNTLMWYLKMALEEEDTKYKLGKKKKLSKRVIESSGDPRAGSYLGQQISLAIQRGNAASILGTVPRCGGFEDVLDFIKF
ncbi:jg13807 [Pararge aegeria aegeria]|uniref:Jg13807 protein n=1 Tax=Pararge aegeria aegeria TaxID=348720 RepID=A0A8S4SAG8_9NEOP|nr:jg13807 [Pararge aegeria aegeria]